MLYRPYMVLSKISPKSKINASSKTQLSFSKTNYTKFPIDTENEHPYWNITSLDRVLCIQALFHGKLKKRRKKRCFRDLHHSLQAKAFSLICPHTHRLYLMVLRISLHYITNNQITSTVFFCLGGLISSLIEQWWLSRSSHNHSLDPIIAHGASWLVRRICVLAPLAAADRNTFSHPACKREHMLHPTPVAPHHIHRILQPAYKIEQIPLLIARDIFVL